MTAPTQLLLLTAFRSWAPRLTKALTDAGHTEIRPRHRQLFAHLDVQGTSVSFLARRMRISAAAMGALVDDLVRLGYASPISEKGARNILPTTRGVALINLLKDFDAQMEVSLQERLGAEPYRVLRSALQELANDASLSNNLLAEQVEGSD